MRADTPKMLHHSPAMNLSIFSTNCHLLNGVPDNMTRAMTQTGSFSQLRSSFSTYAYLSSIEIHTPLRKIPLMWETWDEVPGSDALWNRNPTIYRLSCYLKRELLTKCLRNSLARMGHFPRTKTPEAKESTNSKNLAFTHLMDSIRARSRACSRHWLFNLQKKKSWKLNNRIKYTYTSATE